MPEAETKKEVVNQFSTDFSHLTADLQARIKDYEKLGWSITRTPEGFNAVKKFELRTHATEIIDIQSLDALFSQIDHEQGAYDFLLDHKTDDSQIIDAGEMEEIKVLEVSENESEKPKLSVDLDVSESFESTERFRRHMLVLTSNRREFREVTVRLSDTELLALIDEENANDAKLVQLLKEEKLVKDDFKSRKSLIEDEAARIKSTRKTKEEKRDIECVEDPDYKLGVVHYIRMDNLEYAGMRSMTEKERQRRLPLI